MVTNTHITSLEDAFVERTEHPGIPGILDRWSTVSLNQYPKAPTGISFSISIDREGLSVARALVRELQAAICYAAGAVVLDAEFVGAYSDCETRAVVHPEVVGHLTCTQPNLLPEDPALEDPVFWERAMLVPAGGGGEEATNSYDDDIPF